MSRISEPNTWTLLTALLLVSTALAGCAGDAGDALDDALSGDDDAVDDPTAITAESEVDVPTWQVGDWMGHHVFVPNGADSFDFHVNAIVLDDAGDSYYTVTDDEEFAKVDAFIGIPFFGDIQKDDLSMTGLGLEWDLYEFPLSANKTWTKSFTPPENIGIVGDPIQLTFTVSFEKHIQTALGDVFPGFQIVGVAGDGTTVLEYDYVPAIGFYAHFWFWNYQTEDPEDFFFHAMNMGAGSNWTGTYYEATGTRILDAQSFFFPNPGAPASGVGANPNHQFTVSEAATSVVGFVFAFAISGTSEAVMVDAANNQYEVRAVNTEPPEGAEGSFAQCEGADVGICEWDAVPGEWRLGMGGAAFVHFEGAFLAEIVLTSATL